MSIELVGVFDLALALSLILPEVLGRPKKSQER